MRLSRRYARFVAHNYAVLLFLLIAISILLGFQVKHVTIQPLDYKEFLPDSSETMEGLNFVENNFMSTDTIHILMTLEGSRGAYDWKSPPMRDFVDQVSRDMDTLPFVEDTMSYTNTLRRKNNGSLTIRRSRLSELMSSDEVRYPRDPVHLAGGYVEDFSELNEGIQKQEAAIKKLSNASARIHDNLGAIRQGIRKMESRTESIHSKDVTQGPEELQEGIDSIKGNLSSLADGIRMLNGLTKGRFCNPDLYDPIFSDTLHPDPLYNLTYCQAYTNEPMNTTFAAYCEPSPYTNTTRCYAWSKYDYPVSTGFDRMATSIEDELIPGLEEIKEGTRDTQEGLADFKEQIITIHRKLADIDGYLGEFERGLEAYSMRMDELERETGHLAENVSTYNQKIQEMYQLGREMVPGKKQHEAQHFRISAKDEFDTFFSEDRRSSRVILNLKKGIDEGYTRQKVTDSLRSLTPPVPLDITAVGDIIKFNELQKMIPAEMSRTSIFAAVFIIIILVLLLHRPLMSLFTLTTILFGTLWTFGLLGILGMDLNPASAGVLSMLLGIGIDFGIQMINEFIKYFFHHKETVQKSLEKMMEITTRPILITAGAALLGFFAMRLGEVSIMHDMGKILMIGTVMYCVAAFSILPSILVLYAKSKKRGVTQ